MAHEVQIKELVNGILVTETLDGNVVERLLSYQGKPFFRSTNESDEETYQIIDKVGEIYNIPALATDFVLIDINDAVFIPADGVELVEYSERLRPFRPDYEADESHIGTVETTANSVKINLATDNVNWAKIAGSFYERYYPDTFNYTPVTTGQKILIVYAVPDALPFRLAQGAEAVQAVEPDYDGLFVARIIVNSDGQIVEEIGATDYKYHSEDAWRRIDINTDDALVINIGGSGESSFDIFSDVLAPKIGGIVTKAMKHVWDGKDLIFKNSTSKDLIFEPNTYTNTDKLSYFTFADNYTVKADNYAMLKFKGGVIELVKISQDVDLSAYALDADLDTEIVNRALGDSDLQSQITTEKNRNDTQDGQITDLYVHSIAITTTTSITTDTTDANGRTQNGREVAIKNGVNAINLTCELTSPANFVASYTKEGSAAITVLAGAGTTLYQTDGTNVINGIKGSTFCIKRSGNEFQLQISNR